VEIISIPTLFEDELMKEGECTNSMIESSRPELRLPLILAVEGANDGEFLCRLSSQLHAENKNILNIPAEINRGSIVILPLGGGGPATWSTRFNSLQHPEFHLYDREQEPESALRHEAAMQVNARPSCCAFVTGKRSLENYLHSTAIRAAGGGEIEFSDESSVAKILARQWFHATPHESTWEELSYRMQRRLTHHAKRWLNTVAVEQMTTAMLQTSDPAGEVLHWFETMTAMSRKL
jgi:hypothetical protein